jgi:hypothetical protein
VAGRTSLSVLPVAQVKAVTSERRGKLFGRNPLRPGSLDGDLVKGSLLLTSFPILSDACLYAYW